MLVLLDMIERLWLQIGPALNFLYPQGPDGQGQHDDAVVLDALERRDGAAARAAICHAIDAGTKILVGDMRRSADEAAADVPEDGPC